MGHKALHACQLYTWSTVCTCAAAGAVAADKALTYCNAGVNWLLGKLQERQNVILGDEMGLGKTIQVHSL